MAKLPIQASNIGESLRGPLEAHLNSEWQAKHKGPGVPTVVLKHPSDLIHRTPEPDFSGDRHLPSVNL